MPRMTDDEIQHVFDNYNKLRAHESYWVEAGMALVEYLHTRHGMRYADIYAIAESGNQTKHYRELLAQPRVAPNIIQLRMERD